MHSANRKLVYAGLLTAVGLALQYAEHLLGLSGALPGLKPGLANMITILALELLGFRMALAITCIRSLLGALLFAGFSSAIYSVTGALGACAVMALLMRSRWLGFAGISVAGAFTNNVCQTAVSALVLQNAAIVSYLWLVGPQSILFGIFTGLGAYFCCKVLTQHGKTRSVEV